MPTSKMFFHTSCLFLDDLQYIEIIRYDFFFQEHHFSYIFFFTRIIFLGFRIFKVILTIILILRPTDPENNLVVVDLENFFCGIFFSNHHLKFSTCFLEFFLHFFFGFVRDGHLYARYDF